MIWQKGIIEVKKIKILEMLTKCLFYIVLEKNKNGSTIFLIRREEL